MNFYRKHDLIKIIAAFQLRFDEDFNYTEDLKAKLEDIFYLPEGKIDVDGKTEEGYIIIFYFKNGAALTPRQFCKLNGILPLNQPYPLITQKISK